MSVLREIQPSYRAVYYVPISLIHSRPAARRGGEDEQKLLELASSIRHYGLLQPITVRRADSGYEIVLGERRFQACLMLGFSYIDAFVLQVTECEAALYSMLENSQFEPLHFLDQAEACAALEASGTPPEVISQLVGESADWAERKARLLQLPPETRALIREQGLSERHARALLPLTDAEQQLNIALRSALLRLSPRETEALVEKALNRGADAPPKRKIISVVWEPRLYVNAIHSIVENMQTAGMDVQADTGEDDGWITVNIKIRKRK
ncbi:MAG: ParB/RepB/Spo0J family partition protein [Clostridia bacterium]|nr:ParB/RepB/Spo0J family partition protein [Clostridia bacterium]